MPTSVHTASVEYTLEGYIVVRVGCVKRKKVFHHAVSEINDA